MDGCYAGFRMGVGVDLVCCIHRLMDISGRNGSCPRVMRYYRAISEFCAMGGSTDFSRSSFLNILYLRDSSSIERGR